MEPIKNTLNEDREYWAEQLEKERLRRPVPKDPLDWQFYLPVWISALAVGFVIGATVKGLVG